MSANDLDALAELATGSRWYDAALFCASQSIRWQKAIGQHGI